MAMKKWSHASRLRTIRSNSLEHKSCKKHGLAIEASPKTDARQDTKSYKFLLPMTIFMREESIVSLQRETQSIKKELRFLSSEALLVSAVYAARFDGMPLVKLSQFSILRVSTLCRKEKKEEKLQKFVRETKARCLAHPDYDIAR